MRKRRVRCGNTSGSAFAFYVEQHRTIVFVAPGVPPWLFPECLLPIGRPVFPVAPNEYHSRRIPLSTACVRASKTNKTSRAQRYRQQQQYQHCQSEGRELHSDQLPNIQTAPNERRSNGSDDSDGKTRETKVTVHRAAPC